ncbi:MAG TPA: RsmE family RNA methyltransferase [Thermotogota bacterium]|nr:RsmE family RNA methyltransferase [Thermotogota bacterium]HRW91693.1 RsmE family RNA methyltransferase [Thermotogota bacterium]
MPHRFFCDRNEGQEATFDQQEAQHLRVLRKKSGDSLEWTDGKGNVFQGVLQELRKDCARVRIQKGEMDLSREPSCVLHLFLANAKWPRQSLLLEKATELGARGITIFPSERSIRDREKSQRCKLVVRKALKQCGGTLLPELCFPGSFEDFLHSIPPGVTLYHLDPLATHTLPDVPETGKIGLVLGPEGGFSEPEKKQLENRGARSIQLGKRILRLETAAIAALSFFFLRQG